MQDAAPRTEDRKRRWPLVAAIVLGVALVLGVMIYRGGFVKVPEGEVDATQRARAEAIAKRVVEGCRDGRFEPFGDDATKEMRDALDVDGQRRTCDGIKNLFGDYQSLDYVEAWRDRGVLFVYRFRARYTKGDGPPEVRVVLDARGVLSGFWIKPWNDVLR